MGSSYSCPQNYTSLEQNLYKSTLHLCIKRQTIENISIITDITSDTESVKIAFISILCILIISLLLIR